MRDAATTPSLTERTNIAIGAALAGRKRGAFTPLLFAGPAVIASIAYMDPGNFATNIQAGAKYGYSLLWVVVMANLIAMLFQALSAKLGIVTNRNLAEMCRDQFSRPVVIGMWLLSEVAAMATDLAEFLGGAIALALLFHMPLLAGMGVTAVITYALLMVEKRFPPGRADDRRPGGDHRAVLPGRDVHRTGGLAGGRDRHGDAAAAGRAGADHRRRHYRCHRDAARHFPCIRG